jgi:hypothetical protein
MKRLGPGVYDDDDGGLHLDFSELLRAHGYADTVENRAQLERTWREWAADNHRPIHFTDEPIMRTATESEQRAAIVERARRMVASGAGHECSEWRGDDGRCELCDRVVAP